MGAKSRRAAAEGRAPERGAGGGPRYATREGWRFGRLVVTLFVAVAGVVLGAHAAGKPGGFCSGRWRPGPPELGCPMEFALRSRCTEVAPPSKGARTYGGRADCRRSRPWAPLDSEPGKSSTVRLKDSLGEYEVKYTVPDGCPPGGTVKFFHYH
ncbi:unnamed protein product [Prorocentrum cordatum]|uniref:Peptidylprolyl isomerase n=1 Tax=Prorocentrum cordatum TaxID=2364126 RepID=A0ABN9V7F2_9DINO|nr:unnamed protein product [Polarella glacialis]